MATGHFTGVTHGYRSSNYRVGDGSESAPSYSFISDQDTGIYRPTLDMDGSTAVENTIGFVSGGGEVFRLTAEGHVAFIVDEAIIRGGTTGFGVMNYDADEYNLFVDDSGGVTVRYGLEVLDGGLQIDAGGLTVTAGTVSLPTGSITSTMILDGTIVNADINASAAIDASKLNSGTFGGSGVYTFPAAMAVTTIAYINDTSNANMTIGLTVNQGANDNEAIALKSSDVAHGVTGVAETDTYARFQKYDPNAGGITINGFSETAVGIQLGGVVTTEDNGRSTAGIGALIVDGFLKSGASVGNMTADRNIIVFRNNGTTRFILDTDGDSHQDVGTAWTNFDDRDDVAALNLLAAHLTRPDDPLRANFGEWLALNRAPLEDAKLVTFNDDGHHFVNMSRLTMLLVGAVRQLGEQHAALTGRLMQLEAARG